MKEFYNEFPEYEINTIDNLRKLRNKIAYKGVFVKPDFILRNKPEIQGIITKLNGILARKLG